MQFNLSSVVALLLFLLTGNVFASACYKSGKKFSEIGSNVEVNLALNDLCQKLAGSYPLHTQNEKCQNANVHAAIRGTILVTDGPSGKLGAEVSQEACVDLLTQVRDKCSHGGDLGQLKSHPENYGSDWFKANVILDPDSGGC